MHFAAMYCSMFLQIELDDYPLNDVMGAELKFYSSVVVKQAPASSLK